MHDKYRNLEEALGTLIAVWQKILLCIESNKKSGLVFCILCFLFHFSNNALLLYFRKVPIWDGLEKQNGSFTTEFEKH